MQWRDAILEEEQAWSGGDIFLWKAALSTLLLHAPWPSLAVAVVPAAMLSLPLGYFSPKTDFKTYKDMTASWLITVTWPSPGLPESTK